MKTTKLTMVIAAVVVAAMAGIVLAAPAYNPPVQGRIHGGLATWTNNLNQRVGLSAVLITGSLGATTFEKRIYLVTRSVTNILASTVTRTNTLAYIDGAAGATLESGANVKLIFEWGTTNALDYTIITQSP
jgi:hypothetical protein